jgi:DNA-binding NarL/FixJ family response regulator
MMHKTAVVIVEDDLGISESLAALINHTRNLRCAGTYPNAEAALEAIPLAAPKVALVDINLGGMNGIECVRRLKAQLPDLQVLMITAFEDTDRIFQALKPVRTATSSSGTSPRAHRGDRGCLRGRCPDVSASRAKSRRLLPGW